ncbi:hypothetical protein JCM10908_000013 [Rhodotorula pacifica]|uniref:uncharacterized protein n=1 Tax=Rhodotorula pacifica TaxID=1495444 RepID=UPI00317CF127
MTAAPAAEYGSSESEAAPPTAISPALDFFAGTVAGVASLLTGHPFDTVKVRLQTQQSISPPLQLARDAPSPLLDPRRSESSLVRGSDGVGMGQRKYYRNAVHAFVRVTREEGVRGLYKGVTSPMLGVALMNASVFTSYKYTMNALLLPTPESEPTLGMITVAGAASGVFTSLITTPIDRLKILQQSLLPSPPSIPTRSTTTTTASSRAIPLSALLKHLTLPSLYRGWSATVLRDVGYGPYFLVYEYVVRGGNFGWGGSGREERRRVKGDLREEVDGELWGDQGGGGEEAASTARILMAGGLAGIVGWGCTFPIDVIKTKIQSVPPPPLSPSSLPSSAAAVTAPHPYANIRSTISATLRESGWRGFVAGLGPTLVRSVPVNMVTFAVFELVVSTFR